MYKTSWPICYHHSTKSAFQNLASCWGIAPTLMSPMTSRPRASLSRSKGHDWIRYHLAGLDRIDRWSSSCAEGSGGRLRDSRNCFTRFSAGPRSTCTSKSLHLGSVFPPELAVVLGTGIRLNNHIISFRLSPIHWLGRSADASFSRFNRFGPRCCCSSFDLTPYVVSLASYLRQNDSLNADIYISN